MQKKQKKTTHEEEKNQSHQSKSPRNDKGGKLDQDIKIVFINISTYSKSRGKYNHEKERLENGGKRQIEHLEMKIFSNEKYAEWD